jgi:hypothetical protein
MHRIQRFLESQHLATPFSSTKGGQHRQQIALAKRAMHLISGGETAALISAILMQKKEGALVQAVQDHLQQPVIKAVVSAHDAARITSNLPSFLSSLHTSVTRH